MLITEPYKDMIEFRVAKTGDLRKEFSSLFSGKKLLLSNFFYRLDEEECDVYTGDDTILIRVPEHDFYRLFVMTSDVDELVVLLKKLDDNKYVINVPSKKPIDDWNVVFDRAGFKNIGIYKRYYTTKVKYRKSGVGEYAELGDLKVIDRILKDNFSLYTDCLPSESRLQSLINNKQVLVSKDDHNDIKGVLIFTLEGRKCYFNVWIDFSGNGLFLLYKGYNLAAEHGINYVYYWINSTNTQVINLHRMMGAVPDDLTDYTFINRQ